MTTIYSTHYAIPNSHVVDGFVYGEDIPDSAIISPTWQMRNDVVSKIWVDNTRNTWLLGTTWRQYLNYISSSLGPNNDMIHRWRVAAAELMGSNPVQVSTPAPKTRWKCGHKYLEVDKECPICKAFGRKPVID